MMKKTKTEYLVIGSNNFWYSAEDTLTDAKIEAKGILEGKGEYDNPETGHTPNLPDIVYIYKAIEVAKIEVEEE